VPVLHAHRSSIFDVAKELFPELGSSPMFEPAADLVVASMTGAALMSLGDPDPKRERAFVDSLVTTMRAALMLASR
jgi:hypothetical protein